jgi:hypothetical protein
MGIVQARQHQLALQIHYSGCVTLQRQDVAVGTCRQYLVASNGQGLHYRLIGIGGIDSAVVKDDIRRISRIRRGLRALALAGNEGQAEEDGRDACEQGVSAGYFHIRLPLCDHNLCGYSSLAALLSTKNRIFIHILLLRSRRKCRKNNEEQAGMRRDDGNR